MVAARLVLFYFAFATVPLLTRASDLASARGGENIIYLRTISIDVVGTPQRLERQERRALSLAVETQDPAWGHLTGKEQLLVMLRPGTTALQSERLVQEITLRGGFVSGYLPERTYLILGDAAVAGVAHKSPDVMWVGDYAPEYKVSPTWDGLLRLLQLSNSSLAANTTAAVSVAAEKLAQVLRSFALDQHNGTTRVSAAVHLPPYLSATGQASRKGSLDSQPSSTAMSSGAPADWLPHLRERFGPEIDVLPSTPHTLVVWTPLDKLQDVLTWLSHQPSTHWISPAARWYFADYESGPVIQSGKASDDNLPYGDPSLWPIWAAGITGSGQVIGIGDSGLGYDHAFFADPSIDLNNRGSWTGRVRTSDGTFPVFDSEDHRKIRRFVAVTSTYDNQGHGSHTAGNLAGKPLDDSPDRCKVQAGVAKDAKLSVVGMGQENGAVSTMSNLEEFYALAYEVGARVHSDSWGSNSLEYDYFSRQVDQFTWDNKDFVPVFAAGNFGNNVGGDSAQSGTGTVTVTSPANSKNCIAVGATQATSEDTQFLSRAFTTYEATAHSGTRSEKFKLLKAGFGGSLSRNDVGQSYTLKAASPALACDTLQGDYKESVVLIERGECTFLDKASRAQEAGAVMVIIYDNELGSYFKLEGQEDQSGMVTIPVVSLSRHLGINLENRIKQGETITISFDAVAMPEYAFDNLAAYSSQGPTLDDRVKPDILAPGTTISAVPPQATGMGGNCPLGQLQGTSMATPLVAGAAALVRQYFLEGYYPSGSKGTGVTFQPSGYLVKAVLLGGAESIQGFEADTGLPVDPPPSYRQGYGRVNLSKTIPVVVTTTSATNSANATAPTNWNLQLVDKATFEESDQEHTYCVVSSGGPMKVTLVWYDPPAMYAAAKMLVNDLDLRVDTATGSVMLGNGGGVSDTRDYDRNNPVEQVAMDFAPSGNVQITVRANSIFSAQGAQPYALVVQGAFDGQLVSQYNPALTDAAQATSACTTPATP